jgi:hypothetical protein
MFIKSDSGAVLDTDEVALVGKLYDETFYDVILKSGLALTFSEDSVREADFHFDRARFVTKWLSDKSLTSDNVRFLST